MQQHNAMAHGGPVLRLKPRLYLHSASPLLQHLRANKRHLKLWQSRDLQASQTFRMPKRLHTLQSTTDQLHPVMPLLPPRLFRSRPKHTMLSHL